MGEIVIAASGVIRAHRTELESVRLVGMAVAAEVGPKGKWLHQERRACSASSVMRIIMSS